MVIKIVGAGHGRTGTTSLKAALEQLGTVPAEKLLAFDVKQWWEPLCAFLGMPIPDVPFPHINDRAEMLQRIQRLRAIKRWTPIAVGFIVALWVILRVNQQTENRKQGK